jgi:hypothetical protein
MDDATRRQRHLTLIANGSKADSNAPIRGAALVVRREEIFVNCHIKRTSMHTIGRNPASKRTAGSGRFVPEFGTMCGRRPDGGDAMRCGMKKCRRSGEASWHAR